jgi:outer membrane receptor for ferrienterochelin and colicins
VRLYLFLFFFFCLTIIHAQSVAKAKGRVISDEGDALVGVAVFIAQGDEDFSSMTNNKGEFEIQNLRQGQCQLRIQAIGFQNLERKIVLKVGTNIIEDLELLPDVLQLDQIVVSATRSAVPLYDSPVIISKISDRTLDVTQSVSLAEGLNFSPGLRVENNCSNCGFTQVRMNGLQGAYSQILINSRPIFSALAGVYGLEMIPPNMIERIEVVKGGGSALYGGSAIGGTINIITKDPIRNSYGLGLNQALVNGEASDRNLSFHSSIVSKELDKGMSLFGNLRNRDHWDANADGFSEMTELQNTTLGMSAFWKPNDLSKWKLKLNSISEYRRGGNKFDLEPHQTDITEQLEHEIFGADLSYEWTSKDYTHRLAVYSSAQHVDRQSYYGGGGRILTEADTLTTEDILAINAYGDSEDLSLVSGLQWTYDFHRRMILSVGSEYQFNRVSDRMPGYERRIDQEVATLGSYAQLEIDPTDKLCLLLGGRLDYVNIQGDYQFTEESFSNKRQLPVFVPRLTAKYDLSSSLKVRTSFAQGYRAPQAFNEDLHIETMGGAAKFILLDPDLKMERSNSYTASIDYSRRLKRSQTNIVFEGFHTSLLNPFILSNQVELASGVAVISKRNGSGAIVRGLNIEANYAYQSRWIFQSGITIQSANYTQTELLWESDDPNEELKEVSTKRLLRTPDFYGFMTLSWEGKKQWSASVSSTYTGPMDVAHVVDVSNERIEVKRSRDFFEANLKLNYEMAIDKELGLILSAGVQNIFNAFQDDFDIGADRDAGYIYGPLRPRTYFISIRMDME